MLPDQDHAAAVRKAGLPIRVQRLSLKELPGFLYQWGIHRKEPDDPAVSKKSAGGERLGGSDSLKENGNDLQKDVLADKQPGSLLLEPLELGLRLIVMKVVDTGQRDPGACIHQDADHLPRRFL